MTYEEATEEVNREFKEFRNTNRFEYNEVSPYKQRNMELLFLKRKLAEQKERYSNLLAAHERLAKQMDIQEKELNERQGPNEIA